ncbi:MAG: TetR/AcrR family transcriptional regulator [bacterium]|nr:TetR/AcrR family transcriptional regulator [bacterium]
MADSKKTSIMQHSKELFERFGYQKTTLSDIAQSMGNVKSAVYYYFSGKEEIFAALVRSEADDFLQKLMTETQKASTPRAQLFAYVNMRLDLMEKVSKRYHFLKSEFFQLMPIVDANRQKCDEREVEFLREILENLQDQEQITISDTRFSAQLLMQSLKGLEIQMFVTDQMQAHNVNREAFVNYVLFGVIPSN